MTRPTHEIDAYLDGEPTPDQARALQAWIQADQANAKTFLAAVRLHQQIGTQLRKDRFDQALQRNAQPATTKDGDAAIQALAEIASLDAAIPQSPINFAAWREEQAKQAANAQRKIRQTRTLIGSAIAAALLLAAALLAIVFTSDTPNTPIVDNTPTEPGRVAPASPHKTPAVATLTATHNAVWSSAGRASAPPANLSVGTQLHPNTRLTLTAGFAEITTNDGAIAILEAPATIQLIDDNALRLHSGKLVGICETESSKGFLVRTANMDITDLGTRFGVHSEGSQDTVTVFNGVVVVTPPEGQSRRLIDNQTATIRVSDNNWKLTVEDRAVQGFTKQIPRAALVTAAFCNDERFAVEVVPRGVKEDAKIRTDRPHELNGIDASGIPLALRGGDLIRTPGKFNPQDEMNGFQIELELAAPATIYVVLNSEEQAPAWLDRDYVKTDMVVGNDMGEPRYQLGVGPGSSIDHACAVWQRKQPAMGRVLAGGEMASDSSYTLIAVPLKTNDP